MGLPSSLVAVVAFLTLCIGTTSSQETTTGITLPPCPEFCELPPSSGGRGKAPFRMWYYNIGSKECKTFQYTGRKGNQNRFWTRPDCEFACVRCTPTNIATGETHTDDSGESPPTTGTCNLPLSRGIICPNQREGEEEDIKIKWGFDGDKASCEPFAYYGCGGNANKFENKSTCEDTCLLMN